MMRALFPARSRLDRLGLPLLLAVVVAGRPAAAVIGDEPGPLQEILAITWSKGPNLPQGMQDSQGDVIRGALVSVCGFCAGEMGVPGKRDAYPRGFLRNVWGLELDSPQQVWRKLPEFPGAARQGLQAIAVNDRLYCWGGFSYTKPYCYRDGFRLERRPDGWRWQPLPELPGPVTAAGICAVDSRIFLCGGADYDATRFYTSHDRNGGRHRLGARLLMFDTLNAAAGWQEQPACPGTPRWVHAMAGAGGMLYVFGGATGSDNPQNATYTVVDNWQYDPGSGRWRRLDELPVASGNFPSGAIVFEDRYILLIGGYQYGRVLNPDGSTRRVYGQPRRHDPNNPMCSDVFVYDTQTDSFGRGTSLPLNNNLPTTVLRGNRLHLLGGEIQSALIDGEHFGHHPDLYLVGAVRVAD